LCEDQPQEKQPSAALLSLPALNDGVSRSKSDEQAQRDLIDLPQQGRSAKTRLQAMSYSNGL
jgi:hypothetical protein